MQSRGISVDLIFFFFWRFCSQEYMQGTNKARENSPYCHNEEHADLSLFFLAVKNIRKEYK